MTLKFNKTFLKDGELIVKDLPFKKGTMINAEITITPVNQTKSKKFTGMDLANSDIVGIWENKLIKDSVEFTNEHRANATLRTFDDVTS